MEFFFNRAAPRHWPGGSLHRQGAPQVNKKIHLTACGPQQKDPLDSLWTTSQQKDPLDSLWTTSQQQDPLDSLWTTSQQKDPLGTNALHPAFKASGRPHDSLSHARTQTKCAHTPTHTLSLSVSLFCTCAQDFEVDSIGGLTAVIVMNANSSEQARGSLGILNWVGDRLLYLAHLRRPNTIAGGACGLNIRVLSVVEVSLKLSPAVPGPPEAAKHHSR